MPLLIDFQSPCDNYKLTFEDDGKVAYGYLKNRSNIIGDVWLYNRCETPNRCEQTDKNNIPFANSTEYVSKEAHYQKDVGSDDVLVTWEYGGHGPVAYIYVHEDLLGIVGKGDKPGYSKFAVKDGPLGRKMEIV